jgi:molecular chaperone DnaJ
MGWMVGGVDGFGRRVSKHSFFFQDIQYRLNMSTDYYDTLGVSRQATQEDIIKAYKSAALKCHPDKPGGDKQKFQELSDAYNTLSVQDKRAEYDLQMFGGGGGGVGGVGGRRGSFGFPDEIFQMFFRGMGGGGVGGVGPVKGDDIRSTCVISLCDVFHGVPKKTFVWKVSNKCSSCERTCVPCKGAGSISNVYNSGGLFSRTSVSCNTCSGRGTIHGSLQDCVCRGTGSVDEEVRKVVDIPENINDGDCVIFKGAGCPGKNGGPPGNMIVAIQINKSEESMMGYQRDGPHLLRTHKISFEESMSGCTVEIPHPSGDTISFHTSRWNEIIDPRKTYVIDGMGLKGGELRFVFDIVYPPPGSWKVV